MSKPKIVLKKLKALDKIWHPESSLVFKSLEDKKVIGRYTDNEFISLDEVALQLCQDWNFAYDPDLVEEASEVDEKSNTDDQESEQEDSSNTVVENTKPEALESKEEEVVDPDPPVDEIEPEPPVEEVVVVEHKQPVEEVKTEHVISSKITSNLILLNADKSVDVNEENLVELVAFNKSIERVHSLFYHKVHKYEELEKKYNELVLELKETKETLSDIKNKFENIKKFLQ
jgi:cobalamin biosynthesis protein CobT